MRTANEFVAFLLRQQFYRHTSLTVYGVEGDEDVYVETSIFWPEIQDQNFRLHVVKLLTTFGYANIVDKTVVRPMYKWFHFNAPKSLPHWTMKFMKGNN